MTDLKKGDLRKIVVVPYNPAWPEMFRREAKAIAEVFGEQLIAIHHIGSTSVPGLCAKPIIDILPLVKDIEQVDAYNDAMAELGYEAMGEYGLPGRRYFRKGGQVNRSHQAHTYALGNPEIDRHLAFRDYLRTHPDVAEEYCRLKMEVARQHPHDIYGYMDGKDAFIKAVEKKALAWWEQTANQSTRGD